MRPSPEAVWLWLYRNALQRVGQRHAAAEADEGFKAYMERFGPSAVNERTGVDDTKTVKARRR